MGQVRHRRRAPFWTINRPAWQAGLPPTLRIAAEWQFGTWILLAIVGAVRGELLALPAGLGFSFFLFLFLSGWSESRRINTPVLWWAFVLGMSLLPAFSVALLFLDTPE
jgi:hypothetical protein